MNYVNSELRQKLKRLAEKRQEAALLLAQLTESVALHALVGRIDGPNQMEAGEEFGRIKCGWQYQPDGTLAQRRKLAEEAGGRIAARWQWDSRPAKTAPEFSRKAVSPSGKVYASRNEWVLVVRTGIDTDQIVTHRFNYEDVPDVLKPTLYRALR